MIRNFQLTASEFDWNISGDIQIKAWGFNNTVPGPILRAKKGDTIVVEVKNDLPESTIVHWHGIRLPSAMDGNNEAQPVIAAGGSFRYEFKVEDAGTFWYHSHQNEIHQMERGMYGALIVEDDSDPVFDKERVLVLDDMKLNEDGSFTKGNFLARWKERHDGRQGDILLVNGKHNQTIEMNAGQVERWRIVNAASARYYRLSFGNREFRIIGTDGGLIEAPVTVTEVMLTPGERIDIAVGPFNTGEEFTLESLAYNRMTFVKSNMATVARIKVGAQSSSVATLPGKLRQIEMLADRNAEVNRRIRFSVGASMKRGIDFLVNGDMHHHDSPVRVGELQVWEVSNTSLMDHPFHLHGFFFQVLEENGKVPAYKAWKDTYNLKPRSKVKIAWMPDDRTGEWMYHCHILEHHQAGMMGHFRVVKDATAEHAVHRH